MNSCYEITKCEVCKSTELTPVLDLGEHPLCDDLIPVDNLSKCQVFPINILYCDNCGTAHQKYQVPKAQLFPQTYHYRSRFTADVLSGMDNLVNSVESRIGSLEGLTVLDVGCNDGSLLDRFASKGAKTVGIEPTGAYADALGRNHIVINDFFSASTAQEIKKRTSNIDVITFTNVFAHIEDLASLLEAIKLLIDERTILVIENHYLGSVLTKNQFDTFYHEHPRTYSLNSFSHIAKTLSRKVVSVDFPRRYGGNIRVMIGNSDVCKASSSELITTTLERESRFLEDFASMRSFVNTWKESKKTELMNLVKKHGRLIAKAFPGRAAILVALLELSDKEIEVVYEKPGSLKVGHYLPGTRIPIRSDDELFDRLNKTEVLINFAWHIPDEIENYLRSKGYNGQLVHIV